MEKIKPNCADLPRDWQPSQKHIHDIITSTHENKGCIFFNQDISCDGSLVNLKVRRIYFRKRKYSSNFLIYTWFKGELIDPSVHKIKPECGRQNCVNPAHLIKKEWRKRERLIK